MRQPATVFNPAKQKRSPIRQQRSSGIEHAVNRVRPILTRQNRIRWVARQKRRVMRAICADQGCVRSGHSLFLPKFLPERVELESGLEFSRHRISMSAVRNDNVDSEPWFWLGRSGCKPSRQPPVTESYKDTCKSLSPRNQLNATQASLRQRSSPVIRYATMQADTAPAASIGC